MKKNIYVLLLIFLSCLLYYRTHINKIFYPNDYFLSCTDFGQYLIELKNYSRENTYYRDILTVGEDPGFFIVASNLLRITNIPDQSILSILSIFMYCLVGFILFLLGVKLANKNRFFVWFICVLLYISLNWNINANYSGIWRQIMGHLFFLLFLFSFYHRKNKWYIVIWIIFLSMSIITHRIFFVTWSATLFGMLVYSYFYDKKDFNKNIYFIFITLFLCAPYFIYFVNYVLHFIDYLLINKNTEQFVWYQKYKGPKYLGYSFYWPNDGTTPILQYFYSQGYMLIATSAFLKKTFKNFYWIYIFVFLFLLCYVSLKIDFSARFLLIFELIIIPIAAINFTSYSRHQKLLIIASIFLVWFNMISGVRLQRIASQRIDMNEWIKFLTDHVDKKSNHFIMGTVCTGDLMSQLGYSNHFSYNMSLYRVREAKANQELDFGDLQDLVLANIYYLKKDWKLLDFFKNKAVYIVFIDQDIAEVDLIKKWRSDLLNKPYISLIYPNDSSIPWIWKIKYIFKINNNLISYADVKTYFSQNVQNFNLNVDN